MSILPDGTIKFNCDFCFTNYVKHPITRQRMSLVPNEAVYNTWSSDGFPSCFHERARKTMDGLYGDLVKDVPILGYRMCWYVSQTCHCSATRLTSFQGCFDANTRLSHNSTPAQPESLHCHRRVISWLEVLTCHWRLHRSHDGRQAAERVR